MTVEYLQGKVGTGVRAAWVGEKTMTSFAVYVYVRNMTSAAFNAVHGGSATSVGTRLINTTNATIGCENVTTGVDVPVTGVNLESDPLVSTNADSRLWTGLRVRRFEFTGLQSGTEYRVRPYTNTVTATDESLGTLKDFTFKVRTLNENTFSGFNWACDNGKFLEIDSVNALLVGNKSGWYDVVEKMADLGSDICICQDDLDYSGAANAGVGSGGREYFNDPVDLTSDTADSNTAAISNFGTVLKDAVLDVEEIAATGANTYDPNYYLVQRFFRALMHPGTLMAAMRVGLTSTDSGDQFGHRANGAFWLTDNFLVDAFVVDYGTASSDETATRVADADAVNWVQDKDSGAIRDLYAQTGNAIATNFKTDVESCGTMIKNHKLLMEYFFGRAIGTQAAETPLSWKAGFSDHNDFGGTLALDDFIARPIWRVMDTHPLVDVVYLNTTYWTDSTRWNNGEIDSSSKAAYPVLALDPTQTKTLGAEQMAWLTTTLNASNKDFIIICIADPCLKVADPLTANTAYGQLDCIAVKSTTEHAELMTLLGQLTTDTGDTQGVLILTGDNHTQGMSSDNGNIVQLMGSGFPAGPRAYVQEGTGFVGQYDSSEADAGDRNFGFNRFVVKENTMYAYNIQFDSDADYPLGTDVAYFTKGGTKWQYTTRDNHQNTRTVVSSGLVSLRGN